MFSYKYKNNGNPTVEGSSYIVLSVVIDALEYQQGGINLLDEIEPRYIKSVLEFCANRICDEWDEHCGSCSLRNTQDGIYTVDDFVNRFEKIKFMDSKVYIIGRGEGIYVAPGTLEDFFEHWKGIDGWQVAKEALKNGRWKKG